MKTISIRFNCRDYLISEEARHYKYIVLPDGMVIEPTLWDYEIPSNIEAKIIHHPFKNQSVNYIALCLGNAIIAWEE